MRRPSFSVCIPTYNKSPLLREAIGSVLAQDFKDFELVVVDDCSPDDTGAVVASFDDPRIRYVRNEVNLGLAGNLQRCADLSQSELLYLLCQDDILLEGALRKAHEPFRDDDVGIVTRPYYWFENDVTVPTRAIPPPDRYSDTTLGILDGSDAVAALFRSAGQISGLAFRRRDLCVRFHDDIFVTHIRPFADILRTRKAVFLHDYTVAARTESSMTRSRPEIYDKSPTRQWIDMFESVYAEPKFAAVRKQGIDFICGTNYEGLVQIATTASRRSAAREIRILARGRPRNLLNPEFWAYSVGTMALPPRFLRFLADQYKYRVLSGRLRTTMHGA